MLKVPFICVEVSLYYSEKNQISHRLNKILLMHVHSNVKKIIFVILSEVENKQDKKRKEKKIKEMKRD